jgi:hypothetical protein
MAYLVRRPSGTVQVRESVRTARGPRSRTLASFSGPLDDAVLDEVERRATQPVDRAGLIERARAMGLMWESSAAGAARRLVHGLRRGESIDPALLGLLHVELEACAPARASIQPDEFEEAAEWIGATAEERASSLRGLLRLGDAIARSRGRRSADSGAAYPALRARAEAAAGPGVHEPRSHTH